MESWLSFIGMIIVAIISLIGVLIQTKSREKQDAIESKIDSFRKESEKADKKLHSELINSKMNSSKRFLVTELTKIKSKHYIPTENQKQVLKDTKDEYNKAGGDSYVDDMYEDCRKEGLL